MTDDTVSAPVSPLAAGLTAAAAGIVPLALSASTSPTPNPPRAMLWYKTLRTPSFKPPDAAVPLAWAAIETALAFAAYRLLRKARLAGTQPRPRLARCERRRDRRLEPAFLRAAQPAGQHRRSGHDDRQRRRLSRRVAQGRWRSRRRRLALRRVGRVRHRAHRGDLAPQPLTGAKAGGAKHFTVGDRVTGGSG